MTAAEFGGVDVDLLADYIGGALTGTPDEAAVATLIVDDPAWRQAHARLNAGMAAVGAELGRLAPEPMPADLAERLDALLTSPIADPGPIPEELAAPPVPHLSAVRGPDAADDGAQGVRDERSPRRRSSPGAARRLRWVTPIAIAAGVVAFFGFGLDYLSGRQSASDTATSSGAGMADSKAEKAAPAAPGGMQILTTGIDYTRATLATAPAAQALAAPDTGGGSVSGKPVPNRNDARTDPLSRLRAPDALQTCLDAIGQENGREPISPMTVDYARFDGKPAIVVRFTASNGFWAWASGPSCGMPSGDADTLAKAPVR